MANSGEEKRVFQRIFFKSAVEITTPDQSFSTELIDLSLNGALIQLPSDWVPVMNQDVKLEIHLSDGETTISMEATITHIEEHQVGLKRNHIDMESISHLRRLVELNLGDDELLHRELEHLIESTES